MVFGAEELKVNIIGDASNLKGALDNAGGHVTGFSEKIGKIGKVATIAGGVVTAAFAAIVKKTADVGDKFDKMSLRTGIAVEDLSSLAYACDITGTDIEGLETGIKFLTRGMDDASKGIGEAKDAFEELDISIIDTEGNLRPTVDVLKEAATKISAIENPAKQAALAMEIFGARSGTQLVPLLKEGGKGIEELMNKAKDLGITMSTEAATKAAEFTDRMTDLKGSLAGAGRSIGEVLIPAIIPLIEKVTEIVGKVSAWAKENPELVSGIIKVAAVVGAIAAVGGPILMAVAAFSKIAGAISAIGTISTGPIGLLILAIGGVVLVWKNWDKIIDFLKGFIDKIKGIFGGLINFLGGIGEKIAGIVATIGAKVKGLLEKVGIVGKETTIKVETPTIPFHQEGIVYVPRKALYGLDVGERVLTAKENISYDQRKNNSFSINIDKIIVEGNGDESKIRRTIEKTFEECIRQYGRRGFELAV